MGLWVGGIELSSGFGNAKGDEPRCGVQGQGETEAKAVISGSVYLLVLQASLAGSH